MDENRTKYAINRVEGNLRIKSKVLGMKFCIGENSGGDRFYYFMNTSNDLYENGVGSHGHNFTLEDAIEFVKNIEHEVDVNDYLDEMHQVYKVNYEVFKQQYLDELETGADFDTIKRNLWKRYRNDID